jgi:hypothetical protein
MPNRKDVGESTCGRERRDVGAPAPRPLSPDTALPSLPDRGSAQADGDTYQELCALQLRGSLTHGSGPLLRAVAAVRGRVQRPRRGWDRWSCWHRASDLQRIPGGKSSAGAAACRRCPRGTSSTRGEYAASHRCRIRHLWWCFAADRPFGESLWGQLDGSGGPRGASRGLPGPGDAVCAVYRPFPVPQTILGPPLLWGGAPMLWGLCVAADRVVA